MSPETNTPPNESIDTPEAEDQWIDSEWFDQLQELRDLAVFEYFGTDDPEPRREQKRLYLAGEITNPTLDYPKLDVDKLEAKDKALNALKKDIITPEEGDGEEKLIVRQLYRLVLNETIAETRMVKQAALVQRAVEKGDEEAKQKHIEKFNTYQEFIYGKPNEAIFAYYSNGLRRQAQQALESDEPDEELVKAANEVLELFPTDLETEEGFLAVDDSDQHEEIARRLLEEHGVGIDEEIEPKQIFGMDHIIEYFLKQKGLIQGGEAYDIGVNPNPDAPIQFNAMREDLRVPDEKELPFITVQKLGMHEIHGHMKRAAHGRNSQVRLLSFGFDRNVMIEEGVGLYNERAFEKESDPMAGYQGVISIGLAKGLDRKIAGLDVDQPQRDFDQSYKAMEKIYRLQALLDKKENPEEWIANRAWGRTVRTFRGSPCDVPGAVDMRDRSYGEGIQEVKAFISEDLNRIALLSIGRLNPTWERHIVAAFQLGIIDEDLKKLAGF